MKKGAKTEFPHESRQGIPHPLRVWGPNSGMTQSISLQRLMEQVWGALQSGRRHVGCFHWTRVVDRTLHGSSSLQDVPHVVLGSSSLKITLRWKLSDEQ